MFTTTADPDFDYEPNQVINKLPFSPQEALKTAGTLFNIVSNQSVMSSLETVLRESYKFIRLADDLHDIKWYLNDIRLCFVALTISGYVGLILYGLIMCVGSRRRVRRAGEPSTALGGGGGGLPTAPYSTTAMAASTARSRPHRQSIAAAAQYDEEMNFGAWKQGDDTFKLNPGNRVNTDRYATRSLNRNFQPNYSSKPDGVDSPSKKLLLENHNAVALSGVLASDALNNQPSNAPAGQQQQQQQYLATTNRENGGIGQRI